MLERVAGGVPPSSMGAALAILVALVITLVIALVILAVRTPAQGYSYRWTGEAAEPDTVLTPDSVYRLVPDGTLVVRYRLPDGWDCLLIDPKELRQWDCQWRPPLRLAPPEPPQPVVPRSATPN